jgi:hypothetical protein
MYTSTSIAPVPTSSSITPRVRRTDASAPDMDYDDRNLFPRVVKIEERSLPHGSRVAPYCQKMQLLDDNRMVVAQPEGVPQIFELDESDWRPSRRSVRVDYVRFKPHHLQKRTEPDNSCHCQWLLS